MKNIYWLSDEDYKKAISQLKLQLNGVFEPFKQYGQDIYVPGAVVEIVKLAEDFSLRCRGVDKAISLEMVRKKRR